MISVVIVNWNSGDLLGRCLSALARFAPDCRAVVVDNASDDGSWQPAGGSEDARLIRNAENRGFAAACNQGWRAVDGDPVLFLNPDTEACDAAIPGLAASLGRRQEAWAAAGQLVGPAGEPQKGFNVRRFPTIASVAADALLLEEIWPGNPWSRRLRMDDEALDSECDVEQPAAACLMVRRSALEALNGFDERFHPAWFEDVDICRRIHARGGRIRFVPEARFMHVGGSSLRRLPFGEFLWHFNRNRIRYFEKHHGEASAARVRRLLIAGMRLRALAASLGAAPGNTSKTEAAQAFRETARRLGTERS
jgi:N-acetylglucosaminyl-diphospho-decaprenol L-rhamnosyltransferase